MTDQGLLFDGAAMEKGAHFSKSRVYRYALWRIWDRDKPAVMFVGLNPSTADENVDDPTIKRCISFARDWGYGSLYMLNLFAFRATKPKDMKKAVDKVGWDNDAALKKYASKCDEIVAAWGVNGSLEERNRFVCDKVLFDFQLMCLVKTKDGHPKHPLYVLGNTKRIVFLDDGSKLGSCSRVELFRSN